MGMQIPTLTKDGVKHKMNPLKEIDEKVCSAIRVCVVDERMFLDTMRHEYMCFTIISKEGMIEEMASRLELHMLMKMQNHHILKMLKEEKS